jgi:hypothetical protein
MILGFFFVQPIPLPEDEAPVVNREGHSETSSSAYEQLDNSRTRLLDHDHIEGNDQMVGQDDEDDSYTRTGDNVELSASSGSQDDESRRRSLSRGAAMALDMLPNLHGMKLWCSSDFWLLFVILSIRAFSCLSSTFVYL